MIQWYNSFTKLTLAYSHLLSSWGDLMRFFYTWKTSLISLYIKTMYVGSCYWVNIITGTTEHSLVLLAKNTHWLVDNMRTVHFVHGFIHYWIWTSWLTLLNTFLPLPITATAWNGFSEWPATKLQFDLWQKQFSNWTYDKNAVWPMTKQFSN